MWEVGSLRTELHGAWLLVPQLPLQVALLQLFQRFGKPLVMGQAWGTHGADGLHPVGTVASSAVVT